MIGAISVQLITPCCDALTIMRVVSPTVVASVSPDQGYTRSSFLNGLFGKRVADQILR